MTLFEQYDAAKAECPNAICIIRAGDFYEAIGDDAATIAACLGLTLTEKGGRALAGFPYHQLSAYLGKLVKERHRVAVCDYAQENAS